MRKQQIHRSRYVRLTACVCAVLSGVAAAQEGAGPVRAWAIEPSVSLRLTGTDNHRLVASKESDTVTEAGAGLRVVGTGGRVRGFLDYALTGIAYARHSDLNDVRHRLTAVSTAELVDGFAFIDAQAGYTRQAVSAFGVQQSASSVLDPANQTDTASVSVSPSLRGRFSPSVRYEARALASATRAKDTAEGDVDSYGALLSLEGGLPGSLLGWKALARHDVTDYVAGRRTFDSRLLAGVNYEITRELRLGATAGAERTDLRVLDGETTSTYGVEAQWTPTERTLLAAVVERRFFGTGHSIQFSHRTPRTAWTVADVRDVSSATPSSGTAAFGSAYDLFFRQFASVEPDPVKRDAMVRNHLQTNGIDPNAVVVGGFLAAAATLTRTQSASFALAGLLNTVTVRGVRSRSQRVDEVVAVNDDLATSGSVKQQGVWLELAHRLSPTSLLNLVGGWQRSEGDTSTQETTLKSIALTWSGRLGARSTVSAGVRHADFDSLTAPYKENAIYGAIRYAF
jgi:uncharacterized protein (PEP-CTERM system associated)